MFNDDTVSLEGPGSNTSSTENLLRSPPKKTSTPFNKASRFSKYGTDDDMLARAIRDTDEDEEESKTSYI